MGGIRIHDPVLAASAAGTPRAAFPKGRKNGSIPTRRCRSVPVSPRYRNNRTHRGPHRLSPPVITEALHVVATVGEQAPMADPPESGEQSCCKPSTWESFVFNPAAF